MMMIVAAWTCSRPTSPSFRPHQTRLGDTIIHFNSGSKAQYGKLQSNGKQI